jgi:clan AA aspartic protease
VSPDREAVLRLILPGSAGEQVETTAVVDTGFDGWLTLPPDVISRLGLEWKRFGRAVLADNSTTLFSIYEGLVEWDGQAVSIPVDEVDGTPLVGCR